jgi:RNA polymerase sigma-70 factor, ECF subfamily
MHSGFCFQPSSLGGDVTFIRQDLGKDTAEESFQDAMLAMWRIFSPFSIDKERLSAWIDEIACKLRIAWLRRQTGRQPLHADLDLVGRWRNTATDIQLRAGERRDVEAAFDRLPTEQLEILRMSFVDRLSQMEIAETLALPVDTVKSRMRLAFMKLRKATERES